MRTPGLYAIIHRPSGRRYVSRASDVSRRWREHRCLLTHGRHGSTQLQALWNADGPSAFTWAVLVILADHQTRIQVERALLARMTGLLNASGRAGSGPKPGYTHRPETIEKLRQVNLGRPKSAEHRAKLSMAKKGRPNPKQAEAMRGRKASAESRAKMSAAHKARYAQHPRSAETCQKLSDALTGRVRSPKHCAAISAAKRGRPWSDARRRAARVAA